VRRDADVEVERREEESMEAKASRYVVDVRSEVVVDTALAALRVQELCAVLLPLVFISRTGQANQEVLQCHKDVHRLPKSSRDLVRQSSFERELCNFVIAALPRWAIDTG
jgi:hypothetical protein